MSKCCLPGRRQAHLGCNDRDRPRRPRPMEGSTCKHHQRPRPPTVKCFSVCGRLLGGGQQLRPRRQAARTAQIRVLRQGLERLRRPRTYLFPIAVQTAHGDQPANYKQFNLQPRARHFNALALNDNGDGLCTPVCSLRAPFSKKVCLIVHKTYVWQSPTMCAQWRTCSASSTTTRHAATLEEGIDLVDNAVDAASRLAPNIGSTLTLKETAEKVRTPLIHTYMCRLSSMQAQALFDQLVMPRSVKGVSSYEKLPNTLVPPVRLYCPTVDTQRPVIIVGVKCANTKGAFTSMGKKHVWAGSEAAIHYFKSVADALLLRPVVTVLCTNNAQPVGVITLAGYALNVQYMKVRVFVCNRSLCNASRFPMHRHSATSACPATSTARSPSPSTFQRWHARRGTWPMPTPLEFGCTGCSGSCSRRWTTRSTLPS